jgi:hypothetical protein
MTELVMCRRGPERQAGAARPDLVNPAMLPYAQPLKHLRSRRSRSRLRAARDLVTDAYAHYRFIGHTGDAAPLLDATGISALWDDGFIELSSNGSAEGFVSACRQRRFWEREAAS